MTDAMTERIDDQAEQAAEPPLDWPKMSEKDGDAMLASLFWYGEASSRDEFDRYNGMHLAVVGEQVVDADPDFDQLCRRLAARRTSIPLHKVLFQYRPSADGPIQVLGEYGFGG